MGAKPVLRSLSDIYRFFRETPTPVLFVSGTPFNILGLGQMVPSLRYISYFDCFDGHHYRVFNPLDKGSPDFSCMEDVVNFLLAHPEVLAYVKGLAAPPVMLTVMFDERSEELAEKAGIHIALPPAALRKHLDSKIVTTQIGNEAGVSSVPNALGTVGSYEDLLQLAAKAGLGTDLVVQTPYGDSGRTTFFVNSRDSWHKCADQATAGEIKVMKRINHLSGTVEGVATRHGTLVGPAMLEIVGHKDLTPYKGGWSGNEAAPELLDDAKRKRIIAMVKALGERLYVEGYRGTFCMDFLLDTDSGDIYLGELNPRISGASPLTNLITQKYGGVPMLFFHLLEFMDVDWELDLDAIQNRWYDYDAWSTLILKNVDDKVEIITQAPPSGIWRLGAAGDLNFLRRSWDWSNVSEEDQAFFLRILNAGEYIYKGADLGVMLVRGRVQTDAGQLLDRARQWAATIRQQYRSTVPAPYVTQPQRDGLLYKIM